jgi:hypothetical protein
MELSQTVMNNLPVGGRSSKIPIRQSEGMSNDLWLGVDGSLVTLPHHQALVLEGRVFTFCVGTLSTGITGGGNGTVPDLDRPEFFVSVPTGTVIKPLRMAIQGTAADATADHDKLEAMICIDRTQAWAGDGTVVTPTVYNFRTDNPRASACSCRSTASADITDPVDSIDLARSEVKIELPANGETPIILDLEWSAETSPAPYIVGPAMLVGRCGGTAAVKVFAQIVYAEWSKSELGI